MPFTSIYMDDITILSQSAEEHKKHLNIVFTRLAKYGIKIRLDKCAFAQESVEYLGFTLNADGAHITSKYKTKILNIPRPNTKKQLQQFIGMVVYLHKYIPNLQLELEPFYALMKKNITFKWNNTLETLFNKIKKLVQQTKILVHPDMNKPFEVYCDASINGMGAVLAQRNKNNVVRPVQFCSKLFTTTQQNWHVSEQEIYAVIYAVEKWRQYLVGQHFTIYTDHKNLQELFNRARNFRAGKLYRWAVRLQEYEFTAS